MNHLARVFLILVAFCSMSFAAPKKVIPVKTTQTVQVEKGSKILSPQKDAELREWIIGIQNEARQAIERATRAEEDTKIVVQSLVESQTSLLNATKEVTTLDGAIKAQTKQLNETIAQKQKLEEKITVLVKKNNFLTTIFAVMAAVAAVLGALWLKVPQLSPPFGWVILIGIGPFVFGLVKVLL